MLLLYKLILLLALTPSLTSTLPTPGILDSFNNWYGVPKEPQEEVQHELKDAYTFPPSITPQPGSLLLPQSQQQQPQQQHPQETQPSQEPIQEASQLPAVSNPVEETSPIKPPEQEQLPQPPVPGIPKPTEEQKQPEPPAVEPVKPTAKQPSGTDPPPPQTDVPDHLPISGAVTPEINEDSTTTATPFSLEHQRSPPLEEESSSHIAIFVGAGVGCFVILLITGAFCRWKAAKARKRRHADISATQKASNARFLNTSRTPPTRPTANFPVQRSVQPVYFPQTSVDHVPVRQQGPIVGSHSHLVMRENISSPEQPPPWRSTFTSGITSEGRDSSIAGDTSVGDYCRSSVATTYETPRLRLMNPTDADPIDAHPRISEDSHVTGTTRPLSFAMTTSPAASPVSFSPPACFAAPPSPRLGIHHSTESHQNFDHQNQSPQSSPLQGSSPYNETFSRRPVSPSQHRYSNHYPPSPRHAPLYYGPPTHMPAKHLYPQTRPLHSSHSSDHSGGMYYPNAIPSGAVDPYASSRPSAGPMHHIPGRSGGPASAGIVPNTGFQRLALYAPATRSRPPSTPGW